MARKNKKNKKSKQNERELYDLCHRHWGDWDEANSEERVAGANRILQWFNRHKNDTTHSKAAALYTDEEGFTGLHRILNIDDPPFEVIQTWLKYAPETAKLKKSNGMLPLHDACYHGASLEVVMALVKAYPKSVEVTDTYENLPLHYAFEGVYRNQPLSVEVVSFLLKAYPESIDGEENINNAWYRLRDWARKMSGYDSDEDEDYNDSEVEYELIRFVMWEAYIGGHYLVVKLFVIAFPQSALMPDFCGRIPLHRACSNIISLDIAMVLLDAAPESATITDTFGKTPLQNLIPVAKRKDENGMLPLHCQAAHSKSLTVNFLKLLIAAYPDSIGVRDDRGMLPFQYAFINNKSLSLDVLMYFVEMSIDYL
eukprot:CAMPEP_0172414548 /NCGR_PEP_ID=MMETSP1064-20121228/1204_1 /TAXON_ID=202472 /ORGANISM="Aulacoseira subarctica , Strain CCAP 1002/5" /LENGTH=368 /DNA_ID=CAMNT_0013151275 /DNA_START=43 /DNA_END=1149 /DNA_ORIENTATION=-